MPPSQRSRHKSSTADRPSGDTTEGVASGSGVAYRRGPIVTSPESSTRNSSAWRWPRSGWSAVALVAVGVLIVAAHLGLGAAAVASPVRTGWALDAVLALVVVTLVAPIIVGRRTIHRRRR